ncbi:MAG: hypothetical protein ACKVZH_15825 [Blastocatellia bacterium]
MTKIRVSLRVCNDTALSAINRRHNHQSDIHWKEMRMQRFALS